VTRLLPLLTLAAGILLGIVVGFHLVYRQPGEPQTADEPVGMFV